MSADDILRMTEPPPQPASTTTPPAARVPEMSPDEVLAFAEDGEVEEMDPREVALQAATSMYDWRNPAPDRETYFANKSTLGELKKQGVEAEGPGVGAMIGDLFVSATDAITSALWKYDPSNEGGGITMRNAADYLSGGAYSGLQGEASTFNPPMAMANTLLRGGATVAGANEFNLDFYKTLSRGLASSPKYRVEETGEFVYPGTMMPDAGAGDTTFDLLQMYKQQGKTLRPTNAEDLKDLEYGQFLQKRDATQQLETLLEQGTESGVGTIARSVGVPEQVVAAGGGMLDSINQAVDTLAVASTLAPAGYRTADLPWNQPQRPIESQAMLGSMLMDPGAIGAGALAPVRFGLSAAAKNATARTIDITARAAGKVGNLGNKGAVAAKTARQVKRLVGSAGLGYVANMIGQGSESEAAQELTKVLNYGLGAYAAFTGGALVLRGYSKYAGKVAHVLRESAVPGTSLDKGARAAVAVNPDVPLRYKDPLVRPSAYTSIESTPARLSKDMTLSPRARKLFGNLADWRAVQTVRGASAATSGAAKGVLANVPFSEPMRAAGEEDAANLMLGLGVVIGAPAGVASRYAGTAARRVSAGDSDIGRMLGEVQQLGTKRPPARADVEVRRTMTEVELAGGDVSAVVNNLTPDQLNEFAAVQGYFRDTVDLVPLNAADFEANVGVLADGKSTGPVFYHAPDGERPRVFVNVEDAQTIRAGDLGRAFLKSDTMPESKKAAMINGVDTLYTPDQVAARERAMAKAEVEARYAKRGVKVGDNDPEVDLRIAMNRAQWQQEFGDAGLGVRQAIAAEDLANGVVDWNRMRRGLPLGANPITFMENVLGAQARGLQISGVRIDPETGRPLDTPESIKRTNPAAADDPSVVAATKNYTDGYNKMRRDPTNETPVVEPLSPERVAQIEVSMTDAPMRARQIMDMAGGPEGPTLAATDPTFGWRQEGNRRILSGSRLPDRVRFANHWKPHFEMMDQVQQAMDSGEFVVMRWDTIGKSADVTKRDGPQYGAITREGMITRWKATTGRKSEGYKGGGNLNVEIADYTTLRNSVLTVLEKKHPALAPVRGGPGASLSAVMADVDTYLANRRAGTDLGAGLTPERLRIAEALTLGRRGNIFDGVVPRDGIFRDARIELVETIQPTGRRGHNMVSNNPDGSFTQPPAKPMPDMGSDVAPEAPDPKATSAAERIKRNLGSQSGAVDVSILADLVDYGRGVYRAGMDAAAWTANMIKQFGERIRPFLKQAFDSVVQAYRQSRFSDTTGAVNVTGMNRGAAAASPIEDSARKIHQVYDKGLLAKDRDSALYPQNPVSGSVVLPPRYGLVGNAPGMPRNFTEVRELVNLLADRVENTGKRDVPFAQKSARFYSDMANEAVSLAEIVDPQSTGTSRFDRADEMLRYLALGSQRTNVPVNSTKSAGAAASVVGDFMAGYKMGFGESQRATRQAQADFKAGKHFNLDTKGVQDKVRTFYINGLSELIEVARKAGDTAAVEMLEARAAKSLKLVDPNAPKLTPEQLRETERILAGKATIDMWDMAAKRVAVPGFILDPKKRVDLKQPFEWTQKTKAAKDTIGSPRWSKVAKELGIDSPAELRYQQARSLGVEGNFDWTADTWQARVDSGAPFAGGDFTTYTGSTDAGLSPGGGGRLYDAQQAIDGLLADELNRRGLASMFGKDKLFARNAQEILWAIEKKDNPILANNDLSLFGDSIQPLKQELDAIADKGGQRNVRGAQVLDAMERAYTAMAMQEMPFEVATVGTGRTATAINGALAAMKAAGDPDPLARMTAHYANNLADELTGLATEHGIKLQVDSVKTDLGGFTMDDGSYTETPQITAVIRGNTADTKYMMQVVNEAVEQQGGNLFRRPSVKELYDPAVQKQPVVSFETSQLTKAQRTAFVTDLAKIRDSKGDRIFTGYTPSDGGVFIGGQFYNGDFAVAVDGHDAAIRSAMKKHGVSVMSVEDMVVPSYRSSDAVAPSAFRDAVQKLFYDKAVSGVAADAPTSILQPANVATNLQSRLKKNETMFAGRDNLDALAKAINESTSMSADQALARVGQTMEIPGTKKMQAAFSDYVRGNRKKYDALPAADKKAVSEYIKQARESAKALRDQEATFSRAAKEGIRKRRSEIADRYDPQRALDEIDAASLLGYMGDLETTP